MRNRPRIWSSSTALQTQPVSPYSVLGGRAPHTSSAWLWGNKTTSNTGKHRQRTGEFFQLGKNLTDVQPAKEGFEVLHAFINHSVRKYKYKQDLKTRTGDEQFAAGTKRAQSVNV